MKSFLLKYTAIILFCLILASCYGNVIYFDINNQTIRSCDNQKIIDLTIIGPGDQDFYHVFVSPNKTGSNCIYIHKINDAYCIENFSGIKYNPKEFKLNPNTEYEIMNNTFGDATSGRLKIKTNDKGIVVYADQTSCP